MRESDIPRELLIGDSIWVVKFVNELPGDLLGLCHPDDKMMEIKRGQSYQERADTFIHELIHALECEYEFELKHKHVYKLGSGLAQVFVDNF